MSAAVSLEIVTARRSDRSAGPQFRAVLRDGSGYAIWGATLFACSIWEAIECAAGAALALEVQ